MKGLILGWGELLAYQDQFYPNWRVEKPRLLFSNALGGEVGEVLGVVTHLDGGGTNNKKYTEEMLLHQCIDSYNQLILLMARSGFTEDDFEKMFDKVLVELYQRLLEKQSILASKGEDEK